jgi:hypothetical protein
MSLASSDDRCVSSASAAGSRFGRHGLFTLCLALGL